MPNISITGRTYLIIMLVYRHLLTKHLHAKAAVLSRLTIVSREVKKKQQYAMTDVSYLHVRSTALKFANALAKPP